MAAKVHHQITDVRVILKIIEEDGNMDAVLSECCEVRVHPVNDELGFIFPTD